MAVSTPELPGHDIINNLFATYQFCVAALATGG